MRRATIQYNSQIFAICLALFLVAVPAAAHVQILLDADDTPGPLDTVAARLNHFSIAQTHPERHWKALTLKVVTYETWGNDQLTGIDNHITFEFDLDADDNVDRCLDIRQDEDGEVRGQMFAAGCEFVLGDPIGQARSVRRPDEHSLRVQIPKRLLGKGVKSFRWRTVTSYDEEGHPDCPRPDPMPPERRYATCTDFTKWTRHRL